MKVRTASRVASGAWALVVVIALVSFAFVWLSRHLIVADFVAWRGLEGTLAIAFATAGAPIASRRQANPIGWLFLGLAGIFAISGLGLQYAYFALLDRPDPLPGGVVAAWGQEVVQLTFTGPAFALLLLLFPTGRVVSARWKGVTGIAVLSGVLEGVGAALGPGPIATFQALDNPYGVSGTAADVVSALRLTGNALFLVAVFGGVISVIFRFRRAAYVERQQLKWVTVAAALVGVGMTAFVLTGQETGTTAWARPVHIYLAAAIMAVPAAAAIAILRHGLYDIDRIINRAGTYATVTALLAAVYAGLVTALGLLLQPVTGGGDLAIATSVIAVAAMFRPVHRRAQTVIDRRFDRARFDAARTIEAFSVHLREEVDLASLEAKLQSVVVETMHPQHVSLWIRPSPSASRPGT